MSRTEINRLWDGSLFLGYAQEQHQGRRPYQEDYFGVDEPVFLADLKKRGILFVLADGMGGTSKGDVASVMAVEGVIRYYRAEFNGNIAESLESALRLANEEIYQKGLSNRKYWKMGTTCIAAVVREGRLYFAAAGDSHLYLVRGGRLNLMNEEHSLGVELDRKASQGLITREEALSAPGRSKLTSYLGDRQVSRISASQEGIPLQKGDRILLCSDGLYGYLDPGNIAAAAANHDAQSGVEALIARTLQEGHEEQDNISVQIVEVLGEATERQARAWQKERSKRKNRTAPAEHQTVPVWLLWFVASLVLIGLLAIFWLRAGSSAPKSSVGQEQTQTPEAGTRAPGPQGGDGVAQNPEDAKAASTLPAGDPAQEPTGKDSTGALNPPKEGPERPSVPVGAQNQGKQKVGMAEKKAQTPKKSKRKGGSKK